MPNEKQVDETKTAPSVSDAATTPIDLASAFRMLNQANREAAEEHVETGDDSSINAESSGDEGIVDDGIEDTGSEQPIEDSSNMQDNGNAGGSSDGIQAIDFNAYKQNLLREIQNDAVQQVRQEFAEQNIGYYTAGELTVRDEQTGRVMFRNPDVQDERDPNYYFNSRSEMVQFIEAWNKSIDAEYRRAVNEKQQELMTYAAPKARLADFLPRWQKMDQNTRDIFDELIEGHEIRDASGKEIGFNVDLNAVANQAEKIAKRFKGSSQPDVNAVNQQQQQSTSSGPALNMPTGNGSNSDETEPKTIGEALKIIDRNKGGK